MSKARVASVLAVWTSEIKAGKNLKFHLDSKRMFHITKVVGSTSLNTCLCVYIYIISMLVDSWPDRASTNLKELQTNQFVHFFYANDLFVMWFCFV